MPDREMVITGLELCTNISPDGCLMLCPYKDEKDETYSGFCEQVLKQDALALLKSQKAEWIYGEDETGVDGWHCSECEFFEPWFYEFTDDIDFIRLYSFCPSCGRKMTSYTGKPAQESR